MTNMTDIFPPVLTSLYEKEREKWLTEIKRGDNISILFFPKADRLRRLHQLLSDKEYLKHFFGKKTHYILQLADFSVSMVEDRFDMEEHIARLLNLSLLSNKQLSFSQWIPYLRDNNIHLVLIIPDAEKYLTLLQKNTLSLLLYLTVDYAPIITSICLFETDITDQAYTTTFFEMKDLFENIFYYPLYDDLQTELFIHYLEKKWDITLSNDAVNKIVEASGGHFWLVKETVREYLNNGGWTEHSDGIRFRIDAIHSALLKPQISTLTKVIVNNTNFTKEDLHSITYFKRMNFLTQGNLIRSKFYVHFLKEFTDNKNKLEIIDGLIYLNDVPLNRFFTKKEYRVLKTFLIKPATIISRDELAKQIWTTNSDNSYSDWAIDRLIARLRKKLNELSLPSDLIQSLRGKGYKLSY